VLSKRDGTGDQEIGVLKQNDQLTAARGISHPLSAHIGYSVPASLDSLPYPVLVMLREAMPKGRCRFSVVVPVAACKIRNRAEKRSQFLITFGHRGPRRPIGIQRPEEEREQRRPGCPREQRQRPSERIAPRGSGCAHSANVDHLNEKASGGEWLTENGKIAPHETKRDRHRQGPHKASARDTAEEKPSGASERECGETCKTRTVRAARVSDDGFDATEGSPTGIREAGEFASNNRPAERHSGPQTAKPVHPTSQIDRALADAVCRWRPGSVPHGVDGPESQCRK
jgi:hypothetical protein